VIVVPTDTVYGLAALPGDADAVQRIYVAKDRPDQLHLPVLAATLDQVRRLGVAFSHAAAILSSRWWPGTADHGLRLLGHRGAPGLAGWTGKRWRCASPTTPSCWPDASHRPARRHQRQPPRRHTPPSAEEAGSRLAPHVSLVIDGGMLDTVPSTLVNVRTSPPVVEREGAITRGAISRRWRARREWPPAGHRDVVRRDSSSGHQRHYEVRSSVVASQIDLHAAFGGVVPELASRAHVELITPIVAQALADAGVSGPELVPSP
jgi:L-threonylcarbamoyladenylate synthase